MKKQLILLAIILLSTQTFAQQYVALVKPQGSKTWGFADQTGKIILTPTYSKATDFSEEGLSVYYIRPNFKVMNLKGEIIPTEVDGFKLMEIFGFGTKGYCNGMLAIVKDGKWGFLDTQGKLVIPTKYEKVTEFSEDKAIAELAGSFYLLDKTGKETPINIENLANVKPFSEGLAPFQTTDKKMGFIDKTGKVIIQAKFDGVGYFSGGLAWARTEGDMIGYINPSGEWAINPKFQTTKDFDPTSGMARVKINDGWAYTNKSGDVMQMTDSDKWEDFHDGLAIGRKGDMLGFFDATGKWVIEPQFEGARDFHKGLAAAKKNDLWGFINTKGEWTVQPTFIAVKDMEKVK
ncbi:WG repeat-containing protein [Reichenbachiella agarivorans]|uniref:WG repeat-containing protein n=1 Tax=Reichenbachiella agarivorans TaxID=2979464 RepID=A0ABY6CX67_9BACT|nr:WG repeat-containing protein [Reichenbachiella agarivorans]UXP34043.1 WG repeat-containing protein [Reichenbachiella agarivorans]